MRRTLSTLFSRRSVRRTHHGHCQVVRARDFRLVADRVLDLSTTGLLAAPAEPVLTGERVIVSFEAPLGGMWIDAEGVVTRVVHGRRPGEWTRALGIELVDVAPPIRDALQLRLRCLPPTPPCHRPGRRLSAHALRNLTRRSGLASLAGPRWAA